MDELLELAAKYGWGPVLLGLYTWEAQVRPRLNGKSRKSIIPSPIEHLEGQVTMQEKELKRVVRACDLSTTAVNANAQRIDEVEANLEGRLRGVESTVGDIKGDVKVLLDRTK